MGDASKLYSSYDQVPTYRKQWVFWVMFFLFSPVAIAILILGDVYYERHCEVRSFGIVNRIVAGFFAVLMFANMIRMSMHSLT